MRRMLARMPRARFVYESCGHKGRRRSPNYVQWLVLLY